MGFLLKRPGDQAFPGGQGGEEPGQILRLLEVKVDVLAKLNYQDYC